MTTTTVSQEAVEVTQADKAMAAEIARKLEIEDWATGGGYFAEQLLDCLARQRQSAERAFEERERKLREALKAVEDEGLRNHNTRCRPWWNQVRQALKETPDAG